ncbi:MAG: flagellar hook-basal body complex protein [Lachnospiraceae bacterium]|nr:flagellar hook-basal body complex protein [Lachnospiraceae bacterium]
MMRSLFSAVSGLKTHQTRMDVIGNNIANVNTEAFKASSVRFTELMYQNLSSASLGNGATGTGGVNAKQVGLGVNTGSTKINITSSGSSETTGDPFDLRLTDSQTTNFFVVSDGTNTMFTRAGSFYVDGNGYLCMISTGYTVQGWQAVEQEDPVTHTITKEIVKDTVSPLQVMSPENKTSSPESTTKAYVHGVLDKEDTNLTGANGYVMSVGIYDNLGYSYTAKFAVKPVTGQAGQYTVTLSEIQDSQGSKIYPPATGTAPNLWNNNTTGYTVTYDTAKGTFKGIGTSNTATDKSQKLLLSNLGGNFSDVDVDFSASMNYASDSGQSSLKIDRGDANGDGTGKKLGALIGIKIDNTGLITGSYDNGNTEILGQIAVAQFANASGLEKVGSNCYKTTLNSGEFDGIGVAVNADGSKIESGELEMSNVDLSGQFTDMIVTQRGFQANSRVITVSDTLLEELINLKR